MMMYLIIIHILFLKTFFNNLGVMLYNIECRKKMMLNTLHLSSFRPACFFGPFSKEILVYKGCVQE